MLANNLKKRIFADLTSKDFADYCKKNIYPALNEIAAKGADVSAYSKKCRKVAVAAIIVFVLSIIFVFIGGAGVNIKGFLALIVFLFYIVAPLLIPVSIIVCLVACWLAMAGQHANDIIIKSAILEKIFLYWGSFKYIPRPMTKEEFNNPDNAYNVLSSNFHSISVFDKVHKFDFHMDDCFVGTYKDIDISIAEIDARERRSKSKDLIFFSGCLVRLPSFKNFNTKTVIKSRLKGKELFSGNLNEVMLEDTNFSKIFRVFSGDQVEARYLITTSFMERFLELRQNLKSEVSALFENGEIFLLIHSDKNLFELPDKKNLPSFKNYQGPVIDFLNILYTIEAMKLDMDIGM